MFNSIPEVLEELKAGRMVIVMDDEGRENEGDVLMAAEHITPEAINFMARHARGLICVPMEDARLAELDLHPMKEDLNSKHQKCNTAWTVTVRAAPTDAGNVTGGSGAGWEMKGLRGVGEDDAQPVARSAATDNAAGSFNGCG